ncbi:hypothetical protein BJ741DRAFT_610996, partial [Chytriomyces cf. hyalinus JEL632]
IRQFLYDGKGKVSDWAAALQGHYFHRDAGPKICRQTTRQLLNVRLPKINAPKKGASTPITLEPDVVLDKPHKASLAQKIISSKKTPKSKKRPKRHMRSKWCPLCRTHHCETLVTSDAKLAYYNDAATRIQSVWRMWRCRRVYLQYRRDQVPKHPLLRKQFHLDKLHKLNQTLDLQMRRDKRDMDALFKEMDLSIKMNQDAFDKFTDWCPEENDWDDVLDQLCKRNANPLEESCSICLSILSQHKRQDGVKNAKQQRKIALLSCGHVLHDLCISNFEKYSGVAMCPICRRQYRRSCSP